MKLFWLRVSPCDWWAVVDPISWCLANAHQPLLAPARHRLLTLDARTDQERIANVVLRRCGLNLVDIWSPDRVVIHYWTALADPRPLFKEQRLARPEVQVAHLRHKTGAVLLQPGDHFLFGETPWPGFRWAQYREKWDRRAQEEADDWMPANRSTYSWERMSERWIPWAVLKAIWRQEDAPLCPNCDVLLILIAFRLARHLLSANDAYLDRACFSCRRCFRYWSWGDLWPWLVQHLEPALLPVRHHGIITTDLRSRHAEEQLQEARQTKLVWKAVDTQHWQP